MTCFCGLYHPPLLLLPILWYMTVATACIYKNSEHIYTFLGHLSYHLCFRSSNFFFCHLFLSSMFGKRQLFFPTLLSSPLSFANDEIVQLQKISRIWANDHKLMRNLASLPTTPTVFFYDAFMLQVLDQMMIDIFLRPLLLLLIFLYIVAL